MVAEEHRSQSSHFSQRLRATFSWPSIAFEIVIFAVTAGGPPWWISRVQQEPLPWYIVAVWVLAALMGLALYCHMKYSKNLRQSLEDFRKEKAETSERMFELSEEAKRLGAQVEDFQKSDSYRGRRREALCDLHSYCRELAQMPDDVVFSNENQEAFYYFCCALCDRIAHVFRDGSDGSEKITSALRLSDPDNYGLYPTVGRSSGLNPSRRRHSEAVTENSYVYKELVTGEEGSERVIRIGEIEKAIDCYKFTRDYNTRHYPHELISLLIARVNVATKEDGIEQDALWGILYIGSPDKNRFTENDEMLVRIIANLISTTLWKTIKRYQIEPKEDADGKVSK